MKKNIVFLLLGFFWGNTVFAQLQITFPTSRMVFQRNNNNRAVITVAGTYSQFVDKIEARFVPRVAGQGEATPWQLVQANPEGGVFSGFVNVTGGWYLLEVRGLLQNNAVSLATLDRVGAGEVFIVTGHTNVQGENQTIAGATDDRVSGLVSTTGFQEYNTTGNANALAPFSYGQMTSGKTVGPYGNVWIWGKVGDILVQRLNVPVLFFNTGYGGANLEGWYNAAKGIAWTHPFIQTKIGQPYLNLKVALLYYASITGVRAVLSMHGDLDRSLPADKIQQYTEALIEQSRRDTSKPGLVWVVSRNSYFGRVFQNILDGQNAVIRSYPDVKAGPELDPSTRDNPPPTGNAYSIGWQNAAASLWAESLSNTFFATTEPIVGAAPPVVQATCGATPNTVTLTLPAGFKGYRWNTGQTTQSITVGPGNYQGQAQDNIGGVFNAMPVTITAATIQARPVISSDFPINNNAILICQPTPVILTSSFPNANVWSTNNRNRSITTSSLGVYSVSALNIHGCVGTSAPVRIFLGAGTSLPPPTVRSSGTTTFCVGESVTLTSSFSGQTLWSNGSLGRSITVNTSGNFFARALDPAGCTSPPSTATNVVVNPIPSDPVVLPESPTTLCAGTPVLVRLTASPVSRGYVWSNAATSQSITSTATGTFSVRVRDVNGCLSNPSPEVTISYRPVPETPTIERLGAYTLEASISSLANNYEWSFGGAALPEITRTIKVNNSGVYAVRARAEYGVAPNKLSCFSSSTSFEFRENLLNSGLEIYPNPTKDGVIYLETQKDWANAEVLVYRLGGQLVFRQAVSSFANRTMIDLGGQSGAYVIQVLADGFVKSKSVFVAN